METPIVTANELLQRIRDVGCRKPDVIPPGWMNAKQFAAKWKVSIHATRRNLLIGMRGGVLEKKNLLVRTGRSTVLVSFFRALEKKRGK